MTNEDRDDICVVGVDFGTLSGRAVVVRVSDGAELGSAVSVYPHAVIDEVLPGHGRATPSRVGPPGPDRLRPRPADRRARGPARVRSRPGAGRRHRHRLHRVHDGADPRGRHPAQRDGRVRVRAARLRQAVAAPRGPGTGRPHQRPRRRARRAVAGALRRPHLLGVGVRQGPADPRGGSRGVCRDGPLRGARGLDRLAAVWGVRAQRLLRRLQGDLPGRRVPEPRLPRSARPRLRRLRRGQARAPDRAAGRASPDG